MLDKLLLDRNKKYAIVMGNEVKGVQQSVVDNCDMCIEIPQYGDKTFIECVGNNRDCYLGFL